MTQTQIAGIDFGYRKIVGTVTDRTNQRNDKPNTILVSGDVYFEPGHTKMCLTKEKLSFRGFRNMCDPNPNFKVLELIVK